MTSVTADDRTSLFGVLFREFVPAVRGFVRTLVAESDVDSVVQATFETAWIRFDSIPLLSQRAWLFGVARNHVRNHVRSGRRRVLLVDAIGVSLSGEEASMFAGELDGVEIAPLLAALNQMTNDERELIQLLAWYEMEPSEIAVVLGISQNTARVRVHRARKKLSALMGDESLGEVAP